MGAAISRKQEQEAGAVPEDNANTPNSSLASEVMTGPAAVGAEEPDDSATPDNGAEPAEDNGDMAESGDEEAKDS